MGDTFQVIAGRDIGPRAAPRLARLVVEWLVAEGIVLAEAKPGWALPNRPAHPPGPHWQKAVSDARWGAPEGLAVYTERHVFFSNWAAGPPTATCPRCGTVTKTGDGVWSPRLSTAVDTWHETGLADVDCPACTESAPLSSWGWSDDHLAFAHLGFEFWNWPLLSEEFRTRTAQLLDGHRAVYLQGKI